jgi:ribonuclease BN (tRNA processing enzyme)
MGGEFIFLDAGSGLLRAAPYLPEGCRRASVLLSHAHADHMLGLLCFSLLGDPEAQVDIYAAERGGLSAGEQVKRLMSFPLWPVGTDALSRGVRFRSVSSRFDIGAVEVRAMEGNHPGGATVYRLSHGGKSVVYCTDFEHNDRYSADLAEFAADCGLLIYDGQFSEAEYERKRGWGHSTWEEGVKMAKRCRAKRLAVFHHDPYRADDELTRAEERHRREFANLSFAKGGEVVLL